MSPLKFTGFSVINAMMVLFAAGCVLFPGEPYSGREFGMSRAPDGSILVLYNPCASREDTSATAIRLVRVEGRLFGDSDDEILWEAKSETAGQLREMTMGQLPDGFTEIVKLAPSLEGKLGIIVFGDESDRFRGAQFTTAELRIGRYLDARGRYLTRNEFMALDTCKAGL
jgi:hypothetical protein